MLNKTKRKFDIYDYIFWVSYIILILWVIAKLFGFINSPTIVELMPIITFIFLGGAFYQRFNDLVQKFNDLNQQVKDININLDKVTDMTHNIDKRVIKIETNLKI